MSTFTTNIVLPYLSSGGGDQIAAHNEGLTYLDFTVMPHVESRVEISPPAAATGECYIPKATATGAWTGKENKLAYWTGTGWKFRTPQTGWRCWCVAEKVMLTWTGSKWHSGLGDAVFAAMMTSPTANLGNVGVRKNVTWDTELTDNSNSATFTHSTSTNPEQITIQEAGLFDVSSDLTFDVTAGAVGNRLDAFLLKGGSDVTPCGSSSLSMSATSPTPATVHLHRPVTVAAGDVLSIQVCRGSGANTSTINLKEARLSIRRVQ